jgi:hypothetical protein
LIPETLLQAMRLLVAHYAQGREAVVVSPDNVALLPLGYEALIAAQRVYTFA